MKQSDWLVLVIGPLNQQRKLANLLLNLIEDSSFSNLILALDPNLVPN